MSYKLVYFDARGRAELIRFILTYAGIEYEDVRIQFADWSKMKDQTPHGSLPYLEVDGETIPQSMAIVRYLGRKFDLLGDKDNLIQEAKINSVLDLLLDMSAPLIALHYEKEETRKSEIWKKLNEETFPTTLGCLEKMIKENKTAGFIVGNKVSVADLAIYTLFENVLKVKSEVLEPYQGVKELRAKVAALPKIAKWLKERKETTI